MLLLMYPKALVPPYLIWSNAPLAISDIGLPLVIDMYCDVIPRETDWNTPAPDSMDLVKPFVNGVNELDK